MLSSRWKSASLLLLTLGLSLATPAEPPNLRLDLYGDPLPHNVRMRLGSLRLRHYRASLAFAADSKVLLSVGQSDGVLRFWDVSRGKLLRQMRLDPKQPETVFIMYLTPSTDSKCVASNCFDNNDGSNKLIIWDAQTGKRRRTIELGGKTRVVDQVFTISADGQFVAAITANEDDYALCVWNTATGKKHFEQKREDSYRHLFFSSNGELLAEVDHQNLFIWTVDQGKEVVHKRAATKGIDFSPDGKMLAVSMEDKVLLWETASGKELAILHKPNSGNCFALKFSADGNSLAVCYDASVVLWDVAKRRELHTLTDPFAIQILFSPDGKTLASCCESVINLWDVATGKALHPRQDHEGEVNGVAVSADGKTLFSTSWQVSGPLQWDLASGKYQRSPGGQPFGDGITLSVDGKLLICGSGGRSPFVRLWDEVTGKALRTFTLPLPKANSRGAQHRLDGFRLSPDGKRLAAVRASIFNGNVIDRHLALWDTATGNLLQSRTLPIGPKTWRSNPYFTPDGMGVVVWQGDDQQGYCLSLQETATGSELLKLSSELAFAWAFSPDGKTLAMVKRERTEGIAPEWIFVGSSEVSVIEVATGKEALGINMDKPVDHLAFSADGRMLAASHGPFVSLWDAATGDCFIPSSEAHFLGYTGSYEPRVDGTRVTTLAFLPGGDGVVTGLADGTLLVHDISQVRPKRLIKPDVENKKLASLWSELADENPGKAYLAAWKLTSIPARTLPLMKKNLHPVPVADAKKVERWIADLGSEAFAVRESASQELTKLGLQVQPALRRALASKPPPEVRRRIDDLLAEARLADRGLVRDREVLRTLRAIQVLERIDTAEAREILQIVAGGSVGARATREARESLQRLKWRQTSKKIASD